MDISVSMFNKDIQSLKSIYNAPIKYDRIRKGYYYSEPDFSIAEFPLTHAEIEALDFSTALLQQLKGTKLFHHYENAINKVVEGYRISKILGRSESSILQTEIPLSSTDNQWLETLIRATLEKQALQISYQPFGKESRDHTLSPYLLKEYRNRWYVIGYTESKKNILVFALDRIKQIQKANSRFIANDNFDPAIFFKYSLGITQVHDLEPEIVELAFQPLQAEYVKSQPLHLSQQILKENKKEVVVQLKVYVTQELVMAILSYGAAVQVVKPVKLREKIKEMAGELVKKYR